MTTVHGTDLKVGRYYTLDPKNEQSAVWKIVCHAGPDGFTPFGIKPTYGPAHTGTPLLRDQYWHEVRGFDDRRPPAEAPMAPSSLAEANRASAASPTPTNRSSVLHKALHAVTKDRAVTHGDLEDNFTNIAKIWSVHLGVEVTPAQVALMLIELKTVRAWSNPGHEDNWIDIAGYGACGGELSNDT